MTDSRDTPLSAITWTLVDATSAVVFTALGVLVPSVLFGYTPGPFGTVVLVVATLAVYLKLSELFLPALVTVGADRRPDRRAEDELPVSSGAEE